MIISECDQGSFTKGSISRMINYIERKSELSFSKNFFPSKDIENFIDGNLAGDMMEEVVKKSSNKKKIPYHIVASFDRKDRVSREKLEEVFLGVLNSLGVDSHQAFASYHTDTEHHHLHIIINKVNPDTFKIKDVSFSKIKLLSYADELMKRKEFISYKGRKREKSNEFKLHKLKDFIKNELGDKINDFVKDFDNQSFIELKQIFVRQGLFFKKRGNGFVVTDGTSFIKASAIHRKLSYAKLKTLKDFDFNKNQEVLIMSNNEKNSLISTRSNNESLNKESSLISSKMQKELDDFVKAFNKRNFYDLRELLIKENLFLKKRGNGVVITDGVQMIKASSVNRGLSLAKLKLLPGFDLSKRLDYKKRFWRFYKEFKDIQKDLITIRQANFKKIIKKKQNIINFDIEAREKIFKLFDLNKTEKNRLLNSLVVSKLNTLDSLNKEIKLLPKTLTYKNFLLEKEKTTKGNFVLFLGADPLTLSHDDKEFYENKKMILSSNGAYFVGDINNQQDLASFLETINTLGKNYTIPNNEFKRVVLDFFNNANQHSRELSNEQNRKSTNK